MHESRRTEISVTRAPCGCSIVRFGDVMVRLSPTDFNRLAQAVGEEQTRLALVNAGGTMIKEMPLA